VTPARDIIDSVRPAKEKPRNILLKLEYFGSDFAGWQFQDNARTVQGVLKAALEQFLQHKVRLIGSGRTDAGVHALAQYANFKSGTMLTPDEILYRLNRMLPDDVVVLACREAGPEFDARRSAVRRSYRYLITERISAINRRYSWVLGHRLDIKELGKMAAMISRGRRFDNFCKAKSKKESNECFIYSAGWSRSGGFLRFEIAANRFLHNMVRLLVGTMVAVSNGRMTIEHFHDLIHMKIDEKSKYIAPACGLFLASVEYERGVL